MQILKMHRTSITHTYFKWPEWWSVLALKAYNVRGTRVLPAIGFIKEEKQTQTIERKTSWLGWDE